MIKEEYITLAELAKLLGVSRVTVFRKVKAGEIKAVKIGRNFAIPKKHLLGILGKSLGEGDKKEIDRAVKKTVKEYGEVLKLLGRE